MYKLVVVAVVLLSSCTARAPAAGADGGVVGSGGGGNGGNGGGGGNGGNGGGSDGGVASDLDAYVLARMQTAHIPGLAAVAVKGAQTVFAGAWGDADVSAHRPVTPDTLF